MTDTSSLPRFRALAAAQSDSFPDTLSAGNGTPDAYPNLQLVLTRPIDWELIRQQYDQMVKYATALRLGTAETEAILRRFTRNNVQHPTYKAFAELGKAIKTLFAIFTVKRFASKSMKVLGKGSALDIRSSRRLKPQCNENKILVTPRIAV